MPREYSVFNFIILISILLFSFLLISQEQEAPLGNFTPPSNPQINIPAIAANEKIHIYGSGKVAKLDSSGITYVHSDYLGSASLETDASRNIVATNTYYPFGAELTKTGTGKYTFTGKELDKTELQYFGARYYDQDTGRFAQIDPVGPGYAYANNNPMKFVDPDGKQAVETLQQTVRQSPEVMVEELMRTWRTIPPQARVTCVLAICGFALASFGNPMFMHNQIGPLSLAETTQSDSLQVGEAASSLQEGKMPGEELNRAEQIFGPQLERKYLDTTISEDGRIIDGTHSFMVLKNGEVSIFDLYRTHFGGMDYYAEQNNLKHIEVQDNLVAGGSFFIRNGRIVDISIGNSGINEFTKASRQELEVAYRVFVNFLSNRGYEFSPNIKPDINTMHSRK